MATFRLIFPPLNNYLSPVTSKSLFTTTRHNPQHVLHQLLPLPKITGCNLRLHGHGLTLPDLQYSYIVSYSYLRKKFWTVCSTVTFINVLISCLFALLAWLGLCIMLCISLPYFVSYFVTCMYVCRLRLSKLSLKNLTTTTITHRSVHIACRVFGQTVWLYVTLTIDYFDQLISVICVLHYSNDYLLDC